MDTVLTLTQGQFNLVYNSFSLVIAGMGAALLFFLLQRHQVSSENRLAVTISTLVVGIALYHYFRIFDSWNHAFTFVDGDLAGSVDLRGAQAVEELGRRSPLAGFSDATGRRGRRRPADFVSPPAAGGPVAAGRALMGARAQVTCTVGT